MKTLLVFCLCTSIQGETYYQIGNSLTWDSRPLYQQTYAENAEINLVNGWHIRTSSTSTDILNDPIPSPPQDVLAYPSPYPEAMLSEWNNLVVQSYRGAGHTLQIVLEHSMICFLNLNFIFTNHGPK